MRLARLTLPATLAALACVVASVSAPAPEASSAQSAALASGTISWSAAQSAIGPAAQSPRPSPATTGSSTPAVVCPPPTSTVRTSGQLHKALAMAGPGTVIQLADGRYRGHFDIVESGAVNAPAYLCGSRKAVLHGGSPTSSGYTLHLDRASYWRLVGFSVVGGQKGLMADGINGSMLRNLRVSGSGDEAIHLRSNSTNNMVRGNVVRRTGLREPTYGVGIYVGTPQTSWCAYTDCQPDSSNGNRIVGNSIAGTSAESVVLSEGTNGGLVFGNTFDGTSMSTGESWLNVKGNNWLITRNSGRNSPLDGFQANAVSPGWGTGNTFSRNTAVVNAKGYGYNTGTGNRVTCDNTASSAASGVSAQPCG